MIKYATYVGDIEHLKGETVIIRDEGNGVFFAQFDNKQLTLDLSKGVLFNLTVEGAIVKDGQLLLGYGWISFKITAFVMDDEDD